MALSLTAADLSSPASPSLQRRSQRGLPQRLNALYRNRSPLLTPNLVRPHADVVRRRDLTISAALLNFPPSSPAPSGAGTGEQAGAPCWTQKFIELPSMRRGCHIITRYIQKGAPEIQEYSVGIAHIFVMHTSCSLTINENASPDVPLDMEDSLNRIVPEGNFYRHLDEGEDDMPAHVKASLMGSSLTVPIAQGRLALGTWQGIWLNEHRDYGGSRRLVITINGIRKA